jgi:hypothetical protein
MIARLAARLHGARLLALKEVNEFRNRRLLNAKAFLTRMTDVYTGEPR